MNRTACARFFSSLFGLIECKTGSQYDLIKQIEILNIPKKGIVNQYSLATLTPKVGHFKLVIFSNLKINYEKKNSKLKHATMLVGSK